MGATTEQQEAVDFGQALGSLLRAYLDGARDAVSQLPGGPRGFQVLSISSEGACSNQAAIATRLGIDRTVMTYLVDDLEEAGMVERKPDPADRRARQVVLTTKGRRVLATAADRVQEVERTVLSSLSTEEADLFRGLLSRVASGAPSDPSACMGPPVVDPAC